MRAVKWWTAVMVCLLGGAVALADTIYTWTDADGVKHYSNHPPQDVTQFEKIPSAPPVQTNGTREAYQRMLQEVEIERRQRDLELERESAARAEEARQRAQDQRRAKIDAERKRLQQQIDALNHRGMDPTFTQGMRDAQIAEIQKKIDALESEE